MKCFCMTVKMNSLDEFSWTVITFIFSFFAMIMNQVSFDIFFPPFEGFLWFSKMHIIIFELKCIFATNDFRRIAFFWKSQYSRNPGFRKIVIFGQLRFSDENPVLNSLLQIGQLCLYCDGSACVYLCFSSDL